MSTLSTKQQFKWGMVLEGRGYALPISYVHHFAMTFQIFGLHLSLVNYREIEQVIPINKKMMYPT